MPSKPPWSRRRKLLILCTTLLIILALALGLGIGLTLGNSSSDDTTSPTNPLTPLPSPNTTLPWTPSVNSTWQIILSHPPLLSSSASSVTPDVDVFDIDLFDTPASTIASLHRLGKRVVCYFSAGSWEEWRDDAKRFAEGDLGKGLDGWPGERWLDVRSEGVRGVMRERVSLAGEKGCDGVDPDNVDGYQNNNGLGLTQQDSINYIAFLSSITLPLNLTMGLKNAGDIIPAVLPLVHFSVNEECVKYGECSTFTPFIDAGKPVFHIEYPDGAGEGDATTQGLKEDVVQQFCTRTGKGEGSEKFSTVLKKMELDGWVEYCDARVESTAVDESVGGHDR